MHQRYLAIATAVLAFHTILLVDGLALKNCPDRRVFLESVMAGGSFAAFGAVSPAMAEEEIEYRQGNDRGTEFGGLDASTMEEPTISYKEFNEKLKGGEVVFVEFLAPDGDVAYATFKDDTKLRIGEGYPVEQHDGYSSPLLCVKAVKYANVPYKFIVKGLANYSQ